MGKFKQNPFLPDNSYPLPPYPVSVTVLGNGLNSTCRTLEASIRRTMKYLRNKSSCRCASSQTGVLQQVPELLAVHCADPSRTRGLKEKLMEFASPKKLQVAHASPKSFGATWLLPSTGGKHAPQLMTSSAPPVSAIFPFSRRQARSPMQATSLRSWVTMMQGTLQA